MTDAQRRDGEQHDGEQHDGDERTAEQGRVAGAGGDTVLEGALTEPVSGDTQSGFADYVATNPGGISAERGNPLPEDEQGRDTEYDPVDQGPQQEGQGG